MPDVGLPVLLPKILVPNVVLDYWHWKQVDRKTTMTHDVEVVPPHVAVVVVVAFDVPTF